MNNARIPQLIRMFVLCLGLLVSCSMDSEIEPEDSISEENPTLSENCDDVLNFPNLGPSASQSQSCDDIANPNNKGTLDCRTDAMVGGYQNKTDGWGSYKIVGGEIRYDGTRTRVERFFKTLSQGENKKTSLNGSFKIFDLSDGNTCIIQSHAGGTILFGEEVGSTNRSAQFLIYAKKTSNNLIQLETHVTINPYTADTGGARDVQNFKILNFNEEYSFNYETGYDANGIAFSRIKVGDTEKYITHNHTTERVYSRYGAYGTSDSGDLTAHIEFKDVELCRE